MDIDSNNELNTVNKESSSDQDSSPEEPPDSYIPNYFKNKILIDKYLFLGKVFDFTILNQKYKLKIINNFVSNYRNKSSFRESIFGISENMAPVFQGSIIFDFKNQVFING